MEIALKKAKPGITQMKYTLDFIGAELNGYIIGTAERPGDISKIRLH